MVDKEKLAQRLMATFLEEVHEQVGMMNRDLLALEKNPPTEERAELIKVLFRSAHTLKGASRAVNVEAIERTCHRMEDILGEVREDQMQFSPELFSLLLRSVDAIEDVGTQLRSEKELDDKALQSIAAELEKFASGVVQDEAAASTQSKPATEESVESGQESQPSPKPADEPVVVAESTDQTEFSTPVAQAAPSTSIRVSADKLDLLLAQNGELLVARRRIEDRSSDVTMLHEAVSNLRAEWRSLITPIRKLVSDGDLTSTPVANRSASVPHRAIDSLEHTGDNLLRLEKDLDHLASNIATDSRLLGRTCDALNDEVHSVRMLPFAEACGGLQRTVRDLAQTLGKEVELVVLGEDVEVDRSVLEGLKGPLLHLVRNAVDHGIELPSERETAEKPAQAKVTVSAALRGGHVQVVVEDDGRGFDVDKIREKLRGKGLAEPQDERELARVVFLPGFSTAPLVTDVSGRGVGLDVVQSEIESLHGAVDISFAKGEGSRFTLTVPLTLTTIRCILAVANEETYALPTTSVQQIVRFDPEQIASVSGRQVLLLGDSPIPVADFIGTLGVIGKQSTLNAARILAVVLSAGEDRVAFIVDEVTAEQEVLVKNLGARIRRSRHVAGATLLPSGHVALVVNVANLVRTALGRVAPRQLMIQDQEVTEEQVQNRLLVVDDSVTTRTLMKSILETAGYDVTVAVDGEHAKEILGAAEFNLVVSDVDMPRVNGFELTSFIRGSSQLASLPVVLVTARGSDQDKARGIQVGASAYLVKSSFDQHSLLSAIEQLT